MAEHDGQVVIVTGAATGIGRATAELLAARGAKVVAADINREALAWADSAEGVIGASCDVTSEADNDALAALAVDTFGGLHGAVLNAGRSGTGGNILDATMERFDEIMDVNVRGVALGIRAAGRVMRTGVGGSIAVTGSTSGHRADPNLWSYNASKAAVLNIVRASAVDLGVFGIRVNAVCPGPTHTPMTDVFDERPELYEAMRRRLARGRWAEPDELAEAFSFLIGDRSRAMTGSIVDVDGGVGANNGQFNPPQATDAPPTPRTF
ncbi:MAG: SDR family oxidoreductase [Actinomycetota bacterium]